MRLENEKNCLYSKDGYCARSDKFKKLAVGINNEFNFNINPERVIDCILEIKDEAIRKQKRHDLDSLVFSSCPNCELRKAYAKKIPSKKIRNKG